MCQRNAVAVEANGHLSISVRITLDLTLGCRLSSDSIRCIYQRIQSIVVELLRGFSDTNVAFDLLAWLCAVGCGLV